jgi:uncharacterized damage-inducible protein DinB
MRAFAVCLFAASALWAQSDPISADIKKRYDAVKDLIVRSAEKMPEEHYSFKPTPEVRSYGAILGHIADAQYAFCAGAAGEKATPRNVEKTKTSKADLTAALGEAFAFCDATYGKLSDAAAAEKVKFFGGDMTRAGVLNFNTAHDYEHYGNLVTYMRMKGLVPPSSEGRRR